MFWMGEFTERTTRMKTSKQLYNELQNLKKSVSDAVDAGNLDEAHRIEGEIRALDRQIEETLNYEDEERERSAKNLINGDNKTLGEKVLGAEASFRGIDVGFEAKVNIKDAVSGLDTPQIYKRDLPSPVAPPTGFLSTIPKGQTDGDEHFFLTPTLTNNAATWTSGNKPESAIDWEEATAPIETVAHHMPILKQTARRYKQLENIVGSSLMLGLDLVADYKALRGNNSNGITGVIETDGVLLHTKKDGKNIKDTIQSMKRKVHTSSGLIPNYVCMSPYALEELNQTKDKNGNYLFKDLSAGDKVCGLTIVEDINMTTANGKESVLVYYAQGASWDIADQEEVTVGLVGNQFIQNAYTLLAEFTAALRVETPAAFCYCGDLGIAAEAVDSE